MKTSHFWAIGALTILLVTPGCDRCTLCPGPEGQAEAEGEAPLEGTHDGEAETPQEGLAEGEGEREGDPEGQPDPVCPGDCTYEVINVYPHDPEAFTQGLQFADGILYEGTGYWQKSSLRKVVLDTGFVMQSVAPPSSFQGESFGQIFGEGIAVLDNRVFQLTWQNHVAFVYDKDSFEVSQVFHYPTEGWGLTFDGARLIMSDGTSTLYFHDPDTFAETGRITVRDDGNPVARLNELEYIDGLIYANVWQTDRLAKIDPATGEVTGWVYLDGLLTAEEQRHADVLNGIAYDATGNRLFVTGKYWPKLFEIRLLPKP